MSTNTQEYSMTDYNHASPTHTPDQATPLRVLRDDAYASGQEAARYWRQHAPLMDVAPLARGHCRAAGVPWCYEDEVSAAYVRGWKSVMDEVTP